jgi:hypothetical protein
MSRRAAKVDANQSAIVQALRAAGCSVQSIASVGKGAPDLLVGYGGQNYLLEVKDPAQPPSARRLTDFEAAWHATWKGSVRIVHTPEEAVAYVQM